MPEWHWWRMHIIISLKRGNQLNYTRKMTSAAFNRDTVRDRSTVVVGPWQLFCDMETKFELLGVSYLTL